MITSEMISAVKAHAAAHYNEDGWDVLVECWDDADIIRTIRLHEEAHFTKVSTAEHAIRVCGDILKIGREMMEDSWAAGGLCTHCGSPDHELIDCPKET